MKSKDLSVNLRDRIVSRHRSGGRVKNNCSIEGPKEHRDIFLKWKKFGTTRTLPRVGRLAKLSNRVENSLGHDGDQEPDGRSDKAPEFLCGDGRTLQKDIHLCSTPPIRPDGSHSTVKGTWQPTWSLPKLPKGLPDHEQQDSLVW